jgi:hypothetical protein
MCGRRLHHMTADNILLHEERDRDGNMREVVRCKECRNAAQRRRNERRREGTLAPSKKAPKIVRANTEGWPSSWITLRPGDSFAHRFWWGEPHTQCGVPITMHADTPQAGMDTCVVCRTGIIVEETLP